MCRRRSWLYSVLLATLKLEQHPRLTTIAMNQPKRIFIFDSPRTRSQLFNKVFARHPQLSQVFHPFYKAGGLGPERLTARFQQCQAADDVQLAMTQKPDMDVETFDKAFQDLVAQAQENEWEGMGQSLWIKEHVFNCVNPEVIVALAKDPASKPEPGKNITNMSDEFLDSLTPVFLIRHPALMTPSWYRAQKLTLREDVRDESFRVFSSLRWARLLFDHFCARAGEVPLLLDGEQMVAHPEAVIHYLCDRLDLDRAYAKFRWNVVSEEKQASLDLMQRHFFRDLMSSDGIDSSKAVGAPHSSQSHPC